ERPPLERTGAAGHRLQQQADVVGRGRARRALGGTSRAARARGSQMHAPQGDRASCRLLRWANAYPCPPLQEHGAMARVVVAQAKGDGIGPEIMDAATGLFLAAGVGEHVEFVPVEMGKSVFDAGDSRGMTDAAIRAVEGCGLLFKGPMETP